MLPAIAIDSDWQNPTRRWGMLPVGTRWQCPDCGAIHVVVAASPQRTWRLEQA